MIMAHFNMRKCKVLHLGRNKQYRLEINRLESGFVESVWGVLVDTELM